MDEADSAEKYMELSMRASLAARAIVKRELSPCGKCYNCDEPLDPVEQKSIVDGKEVTTMLEPLFCDQMCTQDWEKRTKRKAP